MLTSVIIKKTSISDSNAPKRAQKEDDIDNPPVEKEQDHNMKFTYNPRKK